VRIAPLRFSTCLASVDPGEAAGEHVDRLPTVSTGGVDVQSRGYETEAKWGWQRGELSQHGCTFDPGVGSVPAAHCGASGFGCCRGGLLAGGANGKSTDFSGIGSPSARKGLMLAQAPENGQPGLTWGDAAEARDACLSGPSACLAHAQSILSSSSLWFRAQVSAARSLLKPWTNVAGERSP
jgi:hypothetical protein